MKYKPITLILILFLFIPSMSYSNSYIDSLLNDLSSDSRIVSRRSLRQLEKSKDPYVDEALILALESSDQKTSKKAAYILGLRKVERAVEPLKSSLYDKSVEVRVMAIWALLTFRSALIFSGITWADCVVVCLAIALTVAFFVLVQKYGVIRLTPVKGTLAVIRKIVSDQGASSTA